MNEQGCAFVCAILTLVAFVLSAYILISGDLKAWLLLLAAGVLVNLLSGFVIICRFV